MVTYITMLGYPGSLAVKNLPVMQETWVQSLHWEDPLEKCMASHSGTFAWRVPGTEEPGGQESIGSQRVGYNLVTKPPSGYWILYRCTSRLHYI